MWTAPQLLSAAMLVLFLLMFVLFLRTFTWKRFADTRYWRQTDPVDRVALRREAGGHLPFISLFIPARDEAPVIGATLEHMARLEYPADAYEVVVITDRRESQASQRQRAHWIKQVEQALGTGQLPNSTGATALVLALLATIFPVDVPSPTEPFFVTWVQRAQAELKKRMDEGSSGPERTGLDFIERAVEALALALPTMSRRPLGRQLAESGPMGEVAVSLYRRADELMHDHRHWKERLMELCRVLSPTTAEIVTQKAQEFRHHPGRPVVRGTEVPLNFTGDARGSWSEEPVPSTKGRALNWGIRHANHRGKIWGFYDAESRPRPSVLLQVANRLVRLQGSRSMLLQGPVFQVRNWHQQGFVSKIASLYQCISHEWYLPVLMRRLPFVGGTNFYVTPDLVHRSGGFSPTALSEDLDFGVRCYLQTGVWPEYLPVPATEQTPTALRDLFRQRFRWASGYMQVYGLLKHNLPETGANVASLEGRLTRTLFWNGPAWWIAIQAVCLVFIASWAAAALGWVDASWIPMWVRPILSLMSSSYLLFTYYCVLRYWRFMEPTTPLSALGSLAQVVVLPLASLIIPTPFSSALALWASGHELRTWVKTPRTPEDAHLTHRSSRYG